MSRSREYRRYQKSKWKNKVKNYFYLNYLRERQHKFSKEEIDRRLGTHSETRSPCSCYMCGNPRKHNTSEFPHGETLQEYISEIDFAYQMKELYDEREDSDNI